MDVDYSLLGQKLSATVDALRSGRKTPERLRKLGLRHITNLESEVSNGEFAFRVDAAIDAGGTGAHARPMDYVLGGLTSCQHMWCLRWAALNSKTFSRLEIGAAGHFTWRGEYLDEVDAGLTAIDVVYRIWSADIGTADARAMSDTVARRCPVFATLRKAAPINEEIALNDRTILRRTWAPAEPQAKDETA